MTTPAPVAIDDVLRGDCGHAIARGARLWAVTRWDPEKRRFTPRRVCWTCMMDVEPDSIRGPLTYAPQRLRPGMR